MDNKAHLRQKMHQVVTLLSVLDEKTSNPKRAHYRAFTRIADSWIEPFKRGARKAFEADKREILALLTDAKALSQRQKATINWDDWWVDVLEYLMNASVDMWQSVFVPLIRGIVIDQGQRWAADLGLAFDVVNLEAVDWFNKYTLVFSEPISQTSERELATLLQQAQLNGWSIPEMQKAIDLMFGQWMSGNLLPEDWVFTENRLPPYRTEMIARTESIRASNAGSFEIFKNWGVKRHEWLATFDDRVRDTHASASGQIVAIGQPFKVGGALMLYPGDASLGAPVSEFANCRCCTLPVLEGI